MNKLSELIITSDDGHDFYPYADTIKELGRKPSQQEILLFCKQMIPTIQDNLNQDEVKMYSKFFTKYCEDVKYQ
jgi:hypothetical protein